MPTSILETKFHPPRFRRELVARPRLSECLERGTTSRVTLICAPAGFGKTTLLAQWLADRPDDRMVAWLSLDVGDQDPHTFWTYLISALRTAAPEVGGIALGLLQDQRPPPLQRILTDLVNELAHLDRDLDLILDDFHLSDSREVGEAMAFLLDHLPPRLHLVLATRSDPVLPLARLRARDELVELRSADLRFTPEEASSFLTETMGLPLTPYDVSALEARTEGWIAGLQLASLSLRGIPEPAGVAGFIEAFAGSDRFVIDYLTEEVLARQSAAVRDFLLQTAVLDRFTGALCDALTGGSSAASMLAELERRDLFLVPLDNDRAWYRYHPLFADVLRAKLGAEQPELVRVLHRRASDWFAAGDRTEDAVRHALAAEDFDRAAYLMECAVPELRRTRQDGVLRKWAGALPGSVVRQSPVLSILSCANHLFSGDLEGAESRLDDADAALAAGSQDLALSARWADTEDQRTAPATVSIFRASLAQARGDVAGTTAHARRALALAGPADHLVRGAGAGFLGLALWAAGDLHEALTTFGEAVRSLRTGGNVVDALDATIVLADLQVAVGRPSRARRLYERGLESMATDSNPYVRAAADLHVGLAELDREANELDSAKVHLEAAQVLAEQGSITENGHRWFVAMAQLCAARGDFGEALSLLDQAEASYRHGFYPDVRPIAAIRARIRIAQGDLDSATDWAQDRGLQVGGALDYLHEYEHLTLVRLLLAQPSDPAQTGSPVALAGILLERLEEMAMPSREGSLVEIRMLQALAQQARGELTKALTALTRALDGAPEPGNVVRLYLDEGPPMLGLVHRAAQDGHPMARALLKRAHAPSEGTPSLPAAATQFSQREREVLHLLAGELTGPQIARELYVTVNTLRTHTKHIYTKLDATTRASAVRRARERGLI